MKGGEDEAKHSMKWLEWDEFLQVVEVLKRECNLKKEIFERHEQGESSTKIAATSVAAAYHRYLMFAIFASVPDRQRTIRELELGRTLLKVPHLDNNSNNNKNNDTTHKTSKSTHNNWNFRWVIRHGVEDYKTGKSFGRRPDLVINPNIYGHLEEYLATWRPVRMSASVTPHQYLFTNQRGNQLSRHSVYNQVRRACVRLTGKGVHPHLLRDMVVTHFRSRDTSPRELEALALYMGHSVDMQKGTYDKRTRGEKVAPAIALLHDAQEPSVPDESSGETQENSVNLESSSDEEMIRTCSNNSRNNGVS